MAGPREAGCIFARLRFFGMQYRGLINCQYYVGGSLYYDYCIVGILIIKFGFYTRPDMQGSNGAGCSPVFGSSFGWYFTVSVSNSRVRVGLCFFQAVPGMQGQGFEWWFLQGHPAHDHPKELRRHSLHHRTRHGWYEEPQMLLRPLLLHSCSDVFHPKSQNDIPVA